MASPEIFFLRRSVISFPRPASPFFPVFSLYPFALPQLPCLPSYPVQHSSLALLKAISLLSGGVEMIEVTNIVKRYGNNTVLNQATFQIQEGQLTTILGPSGCGKSTMLRCMNRLERFDRGRLRIGDVEVVGTEERQLTAAEEKQLTKRLRERVGIVFQNFNLFPHLTV